MTAALVAGCFSPLQRSVDEAQLRAAGGYVFVEGLDVPPVRGVEGCGAQALAAALCCVEPEADATTLAEELPWHDHGATPIDLLLAARDRGAQARIERGSWAICAENVRQRKPTLVMLDMAPVVETIAMRIPTSPVMHWSVVSGIADDDGRILLGAPRGRHHVVDRDEFMRRWAASEYCLIEVGRAAR